MKVFDCRVMGWGHAITSNGGKSVTGCLTPLPNNGDYVIAEGGRIYQFNDVNHWGNPKDGFDAGISVTQAVLDDGDELPSWDDIHSLLSQCHD